jgi:O-6-methylguanine DNA methyltransferase
VTRRTKRLPEKLYASTLSWEGWVFQVLSSASGVRWLDLHPTPLESLEVKLAARIVPDDQQNEQALSEIHAYLQGKLHEFTIPVDLRGTEFQRDVWEAIAKVQYGQTTSYGALAIEIGRPRATRAVGQATGANPVPIIIPCHRIVGSSGDLTGFAGGLPLKERLLALEQGALNL